MPTIHKAPQEKRTYFLTAVTSNRRRLFQVEANAQLLMATLQDYRVKSKYELYAFVVMPNHFHLLLTPAHDVPLEKAMQLVKGGFSFRLKGKMEVWDRGYFNRRIENQAAFEACRRYIEFNPVRAKLAPTPDQYPYTSFQHADLIDPAPMWLSLPGQG